MTEISGPCEPSRLRSMARVHTQPRLFGSSRKTGRVSDGKTAWSGQFWGTRVPVQCPVIGRGSRSMVVSLEAQPAPGLATLTSPLDVICLSHLRWNLVQQRPQPLLTRCGAEGRVFYVEEPLLGGAEARLDRRDVGSGVTVCEPHLPEGTDEAAANLLQRLMIDLLIETERIDRYLLWYY